MRSQSADTHLDIARGGDWSRGLMALIPDGPAPADFRLSYVPANPASYEVSRIDLNALWIQLPEILRQIDPEFADKFDMGLNMANGMLQMDLTRDLFANLDNLYFRYSRVAGDQKESVVGLLLKDADAMDRTLLKLFDESSVVMSQVGGFYHRSDIQGYVIHTLNLPGMSADQPNRIGAAVMDGALLVGHEALLMDHAQAVAAKSGEPGFYRSPTFSGMAAGLPDNAYSYAVGDLSKLSELFFSRLRQSALGEMARKSPDDDELFGRFTQGFDFEKLPPDDFLLKFLGTTESYAVKDASGVRARVAVQYPDKLPTSGS